MSERLRGGEVMLKFSIDGVLAGGSFLKVTDFEITPRDELTESDFIGEDESDIDYRHDGFDFSFSTHELDDSTRRFLAQCVANHEDHVAPPSVTMTVVYPYRGTDGRASTEVYRRCRMKVDSTGFQGRKEYLATKFSGKCSKYAATFNG
jgi:hypothetical protein